MSDKEFRNDTLCVLRRMGPCDARALAAEMGADLGRLKEALKHLVAHVREAA